ncbi:MAG: hypothetical protein U5O16_40360 [Rhodococcus sp. (in: high G+C Gram-positive bacteria)]|uniref:hypothetical protein n=1 Tax=Rhodococcus sp. TaxID=1831 RepID=UPI002ADD0EEF|nr:hypothetical protein [Rhodococcus sp. (in: high G+C Gram-positive bacteria)]
MSHPHRVRDHTGRHYGAASSPEQAQTARPRHRAHTRLIRAAPPPEVIAAAELLLAEPDAHLYRRRYLELITHTTGPDGVTVTNYSAAEQYLLTAAARCKKAIRRTATLYAVPARNSENNAPVDREPS